MKLEEIANELEKFASLNGVDLLVEHVTKEHSFIPVINQFGKVGAIGNYVEKGKDVIGFFLLNDRVVKYALEEGFHLDNIYDCFKKKLFKEMKKDDFFLEMIKKEY